MLRGIGRQTKTGVKLAPSIARSAGTGMPASAHRVGSRSTPPTGSSDTMPARIRPGRRALGGRGIATGPAQSFGRKPIEVRHLDDLLAIAAQVAITESIGQRDEKVRPGGNRFRSAISRGAPVPIQATRPSTMGRKPKRIPLSWFFLTGDPTGWQTGTLHDPRCRSQWRLHADKATDLGSSYLLKQIK